MVEEISEMWLVGVAICLLSASVSIVLSLTMLCLEWLGNDTKRLVLASNVIQEQNKVGIVYDEWFKTNPTQFYKSISMLPSDETVTNQTDGTTMNIESLLGWRCDIEAYIDTSKLNTQGVYEFKVKVVE